jgi:hypothetical protein
MQPKEFLENSERCCVLPQKLIFSSFFLMVPGMLVIGAWGFGKTPYFPRDEAFSLENVYDNCGQLLAFSDVDSKVGGFVLRSMPWNSQG